MNETRPLVQASKLSFCYAGSLFGRGKAGASPVLSGLNFEIFPGETLGIMGRNGCGKSTLLLLLNGVLAPTEGQLLVPRPITRTLLTLGLGFDPALSGRDNAMLSAMLQGYSRAGARAILDEIREFSGLEDSFEQPVRTYSSGMRSRLGFSTALMTQVDLLLIDETLSVGDQHFRHKAEAAMLDKLTGNQTVVFVSHGAHQIKKVCSRALWLEAGCIKAEGDTDSVAREYKRFMDDLDKADGLSRAASKTG